MSCEFCEKADFGNFRAEVESYGAFISLAGGSSRFPKDEQFAFCPMCGEPLTEPQPLTLDELRESGMTWVWVRRLGEYPISVRKYIDGYGFVIVRNNHVLLVELRLSFDNYGKTWLAYRRPPKEATP